MLKLYKALDDNIWSGLFKSFNYRFYYPLLAPDNQLHFLTIQASPGSSVPIPCESICQHRQHHIRKYIGHQSIPNIHQWVQVPRPPSPIHTAGFRTQILKSDNSEQNAMAVLVRSQRVFL